MAPAIELGWIRTGIDAAFTGRRTLQLGWARQITVFLDGRRVFAGSNPYRPVGRRLSPDGRLQSADASVTLDLHRGRNELVLAVGNGWITGDGREVGSSYGWGAEARFPEPAGLSFVAGSAPIAR